jgi:hypothetical protein
MPARGADGPGPVNATLQPWRQIAFELRDAAPNALAPEFLTMRLNIWVILATLLALLLIRPRRRVCPPSCIDIASPVKKPV